MKKKLLVCCLAFSVLAACKKKDDNNPDNNVKYLTKIVQEADGVTTETTLSYDDKNRLIDYVEKEEGVLTASRTFIYDANGRLSKLENDHPEEDTYEEYTFTYTAAGIPEKYVREISDNDGLKTTTEGTYTITGGKVTKIVERNTDPGVDEVTTSNLSYSGNNLSKVSATTNTNPGVIYDISLTHGSKKNPLHYSAPLPYALLTDLALEIFSENEITGLKLTLGPNVILEQNTVYQYDAQGYPVSSENREAGSNEVTKTTFQYK